MTGDSVIILDPVNRKRIEAGLGLHPPVPVDGICVRVGAMRCHSQALLIKLTRGVPISEIEQMLARGNSWVRLIPNTHVKVREIILAGG